jgi:hypothetical protein
VGLGALANGLYTATAVHVLAVAVGGRLLGGEVEEVAIGTDRAWAIRVDEPRITLGFVPGGWVRFRGAGDARAPGYEQLAAWRRALAPLFGPAAVLVVSSMMLGPAATLSAATSAPGQLLAALHPWTAAPPVLDAAWALLDAPGRVVVGTVCAKIAAFNLLPLPTLAGGQAILAALPLPAPLKDGLGMVGAVATAWLFVAWGVAVWGWV